MELWKLTCFYAENYSGWSGKMRVPFTSSLQGYFDIWWEKGTNVKCNPFFSFQWKIPKVFGKCKTLSNSNVENWLSDNWNFMSETLVSKFLTGQFWMRWLFTKKNVFYLRQGAFIIYKVKPEIGAGKSNGRATSSFWEASVTWAANRKEAMEVLYPCWTLQLYLMWSFGTRGVLFVFPVRCCLLVPSRG